MTGAALRIAIARFGQFAVGTNTRLCVDAPEQAVVARRHSGVGFGENELALPPQRRTQIRMIGVEARFPDHAAPPDAAFMMARVSATRASFTL